MHAPAVHPPAAERREQGRVHVHQAAAIRAHDIIGDEPDVAGEHDQIDLELREQRRQAFALIRARRGDAGVDA